MGERGFWTNPGNVGSSATWHITRVLVSNAGLKVVPYCLVKNHSKWRFFFFFLGGLSTVGVVGVVFGGCVMGVARGVEGGVENGRVCLSGVHLQKLGFWGG